MSPLIRRFAAASLLLAFAATAALAQGQAQRPPPHLGYVYPAGGQQGKSFTISVGGQNLNNTSAAYFTGAGVQAKITGYDRPLTQKEINDLREKMQKLQDKRAAARTDPSKPPFTAADERAAAEIREKLQGRAARLAGPAIAETVTLEVTLAPDAPPGERELRLRTPDGLSNPFVFRVGQLPEFREPVVTVTTNFALRAGREGGPRARRPKNDMEISLPAVVNGQILPGEVDRYRFAARKGQRIVAAASARALIPYLADAVPGWFQATLTLLDASGRELAYDDRFRFNPDPVFCCDIPADGNYEIEIKDSIYRGREDFVYRLTVGEVPFVTGLFPLGGRAGQPLAVELTGWNLSGSRLGMETKDKTPGTFLFFVQSHAQLSNPVRFALDALPECLATEPGDPPENAQPLTLPVIVNGRIARPGAQAVFRFEGKAGSQIVAEVFARRLGSPLDSTLKLTDATGRQLAFNDDCDDKGAGLLTHQADSRIGFKLTADATYFVTLADAQNQGGAEYAYRLQFAPPRPDYELRVAPSCLNLHAGTSAVLTVYALRHDGFAGEILLGLHDAPRGFGLSGARIPAGQDKVQLTLTAPLRAPEGISDLTLAGIATIDGKPVARIAGPAEDMMQAFAYRHLVPAMEFKVAVSGRGVPFRVLTKLPVHLSPGGNARVQIQAPTGRFVDNVEFELSEPPEGIAIVTATGASGTVEVVLACDAGKAKPGQRGNLLLQGFGQRTNPKAANAAARVQRVPLGVAPAIPFEIDLAPLSPSK